MEKLLKEIENNLATLKCKLEEQGIDVTLLQAELWEWDSSLRDIAFKIGAWNGTDWLTGNERLDYNHSTPDFIKMVEQKKILFRKF